MLRRIAYQCSVQAARQFHTHNPHPAPNDWRKVASAGAGILASSFAASTEALAQEHDHHLMQHAIEHIVDHAIWHSIGHYALHVGSFASTALGCLLSFQVLGETEGFYVSPRMLPPAVGKCINPHTGKWDDCITLANGRRLVGQEILQFYQDLQSVQIVASLQKGRN